ncbi:MAG: hypothetical protein IT328_11020 [Caldilineaceae bacterium]|nr:hypothetical protein [Caldilineaceae bacterium]
MVAVALMIAVIGLLDAAPAQAHCDSINGPVVEAAGMALDEGDVTLILPYVQPDAEAELTAAFKHTLEVRALGAEAQELADRFFFETAVRLHRLGEEAPYTGLKEAADHGPALTSAEAAVESGELAKVSLLLTEAVRKGTAAKFSAIETARVHAAEEQTVAAQREVVEAELIFETYVYELYNAALGEAMHAEGTVPDAAPSAHTH